MDKFLGNGKQYLVDFQARLEAEGMRGRRLQIMMGAAAGLLASIRIISLGQLPLKKLKG